MKKIKIVVIFLAAIAFILIPLPARDIHVRFHFTDNVNGDCALYYATESGGFSQEQCVIATPEADNNSYFVSFTLDKSLENRLTGLRLDFPVGEHLFGVNNITVSSAGIVQKQFPACSFFSAENLIGQNDIPQISLATAMDTAYIATGGEDPYLVFSSDICNEINEGYSHLVLSRLGICIFLAGCYFFYKKNVFSKDN